MKRSWLSVWQLACDWRLARKAEEATINLLSEDAAQPETSFCQRSTVLWSSIERPRLATSSYIRKRLRYYLALAKAYRRSTEGCNRRSGSRLCGFVTLSAQKAVASAETRGEGLPESWNSLFYENGCGWNTGYRRRRRKQTKRSEAGYSAWLKAYSVKLTQAMKLELSSEVFWREGREEKYLRNEICQSLEKRRGRGRTAYIRRGEMAKKKSKNLKIKTRNSRHLIEAKAWRK